MGALVSAGVYSLLVITKESSPEIQIPMAIVTTVLPGASAIDTEKLITDKIESQLLNNLEEAKTITSTSGQGVSSLVVEFNAKADIPSSLQKVKDEVDKVKMSLPAEAEDPFVSEINFADQPILMLAISSNLPVTEFIDLAQKVEDELKTVSGVSKISKSGIPEREVRVLVEPTKLSKFKLNISEVVSAIAQSNSSIPAGDIEVDGVNYPLQFEGSLVDPSEIKDIVVSNVGKNAVYVRDVAFVSDGVSENSSFSRISINRQPSQQAVSLSVFKKRGGDITQIADAVKAKLSDLQNGGILEGTDVLVSIDLSQYLKDDLKNLSRSGLVTIFLVVLILFLVIGWREALIAGLAIPFSFLIAFAGLYITGNTINFISLFALILAVGILVDSAIVVTEAMHTKIKGGITGRESALAVIKEFHIPLSSGTMTTIAAFFPLFFLSGIIGEFIAGIPYTLIFVLLASLFVALGIVPLLALTVLKKNGNSNGKLFQLQTKYVTSLQAWYRRKLNKIISNKKIQKIFLLSMVGALVLSFVLPISGLLEMTLFPSEDMNFIYVDVEKQQGTILNETDLAMRAVEEILYTEPYIESFVSTTGSSNAFGFSGSSGGEKLGNITVLLRDQRSQTSDEIISLLREKLAVIRTAKVTIAQPSNGPPSGSVISLKFFGDNLDDLERVVTQAVDILKEIPGTVDVSNSMSSNNTEFVLDIDRSKLSEFGLTPVMVAQILRTAVHGVVATTIKTGGDDIDVSVKLNLNTDSLNPDLSSVTTVDSIRQIGINTSNGVILLGSLLKVSAERSSASISHEEGERVATVSSDLSQGGNAVQINQQFQAKIKEGSLVLPQGVTLKTGGENEDIAQTFTEMSLALVAGLLLVIVVLILQFNSYRQTFFIVAGVLLSLIGVLVGLTLTGNAFSFPSFIGVIALAGIVVNNAIILIDTMNTARKTSPEKSLEEVAIESAVIRLRPILLTTITTVVGMVPLVFSSAMWAPLSYAIIFGLSFATIITLFLIPVLYVRYTK